MSSYYVSSGQIVTGILLNEYDSMYVSNGGTANSTTVNSGGYLCVSEGGTADNTTVNCSGRMVVDEAGTANRTTVNSDSELIVSSGGSALNIVENGGYVCFKEGAEVTFASHSFSGLVLSLSQSASIHSGTTAVSTTMNGGYLEVFSGGSVNHAVNSDGRLDVSDGGTVNDIDLNSAQMYVSDGGTADSTAVNSGGYLRVSEGGTANDTIINSGGSLWVVGMVNRAAVNSGGKLCVYEGGTANSTAVNFGGSLDIWSGGTATNIVENGGYVDAGDGAEVTFLPNTFSGMVLTGAQHATVHSGTTATDTAMDGGYLDVYSGGTANGTIINSGGELNVSGGGTANGTIINSGGSLRLSSGGMVNGTVINSGGRLFVQDHETASCTVINPGGRLYVSSGGSALNITENGGYVKVAEGANVTFEPNAFSGMVLSSGQSVSIHSGTTVNSTTADSGHLHVYSGGTANNTTMNGGYLEVYSGGTVNHAVIDSGGWLRITGTVNHAVINSGCSISVHSNAVINDMTINTGMNTDSGAEVNRITINSGGSLRVASGVTAGSVAVNSGGFLRLNSGGKITGALTMEDGAVVSAYKKSIVEFDISGIDASAPARVNDLSLIQGAPNYTVTVSAMQAEGTYKLADGASGFDKTITVYSDNAKLGSLSVGETVTLAGQDYTLNLTDSLLSFTVGEVISPSVNPCDLTITSVAYTNASGGSVLYSNSDVICTFTVKNQGAYASPASVANVAADGGHSSEQTVDVKALAPGESVTLNCNLGRIEAGGHYGYVAVDSENLIEETNESNNVKKPSYTVVSAGPEPGPVVVTGVSDDLNGDGRADIVMTITQSGHGAEGATGAWLIQQDQTAAWGDLSQRNKGWEIFGMGTTTSNKATADVYVKGTDNVIGAWTTDESGRVAGWETVGEFSADTQVLGLGDFNGNGQTDLLLRNTNGAVGCFFTGGDVTGWNYFQSLGDEWKISAVGDLNGDGRADVVLKHDAGFAGSWLTQADYTMAWADLDTLPGGFAIVGAGDFDGDGTDDVLLKNGNYYGAWLVQNGNAAGWMGLGDLGDVTVEQIADFDGDGKDDLRIRTAAGDLGAQLVHGADNLEWHYYGSVGSEWSTGLAAL